MMAIIGYVKLTHSTPQLFKASVSREQSKKKTENLLTAKTLRLNNNFANIWIEKKRKKISALLTREDVDFNVA